MATLTIRDLPEDLLVKLKELAEKERRSMNAEAIVLIEQGVDQIGLRQQRLDALQRIAERRKHLRPVEVDSTILLREDRER